MDDINARAARVRAEQAAAARERSAAARAASDAQAARERAARETVAEVRQLCEEFHRYAQRARPRHTISHFNIRGWILGSYEYNSNPRDSETRYLVVTPSGRIRVITHNHIKPAGSHFGREYIAVRRPSLAKFSPDTMRHRIAEYVSETGVSWPH